MNFFYLPAISFSISADASPVSVTTSFAVVFSLGVEQWVTRLLTFFEMSFRILCSPSILSIICFSKVESVSMISTLSSAASSVFFFAFFGGSYHVLGQIKLQSQEVSTKWVENIDINE